MPPSMTTAASAAIFVFLLYVVFSFTEYAVHKYLMHGAKSEYNLLSNNHWNHHEHTLNNMELKENKEYNSKINKYLGLYFVWSYSCIVFVVGLSEGIVLYMVLKSAANIQIAPWVVVLTVAVFSVYQSSFWNTVHPDIHNIRENISIYEGIPGWDGWKHAFSAIYVNRDRKITLYDWFKQNHTLHHSRKGVKKGNYNVTLPGADWILGTMYGDD
jgi:hypothetical protein